jgi:hypothetical protein
MPVTTGHSFVCTLGQRAHPRPKNPFPSQAHGFQATRICRAWCTSQASATVS